MPKNPAECGASDSMVIIDESILQQYGQKTRKDILVPPQSEY